VWLNASFWFYVSSAIFCTISLPIFFQIDRYCQVTCYIFIPAHAFMRVTTTVFIFYKLELFDAARGRVVRNLPDESRQGTCFKYDFLVALGIYIMFNVIRFFTRFWGTPCFECGESGSCIAEKEPVIFFANIPDFIIIWCEMVLFHKLVVESRNFRREHASQANGQKCWFENYVVPKIWWYSFSSGVTLVSNFIVYGILICCTLIQMFAEKKLNFIGRDEFCLYVFFLNLGVVNLAVNVGMISLCFPLRSIDPIHLLYIICYQGCNHFVETEEISAELSPEAIQDFIELEDLIQQNTSRQIPWQIPRRIRIEIRNELRNGQRLIQRNWERNKVTGRIIFLPEQSTSPEETTSESSGTSIMLDIPGNDPSHSPGNIQVQIVPSQILME